MKVLIIGANGKVGRIIVDKMIASSEFEPVTLIRNREQTSYFEQKGVETGVASIEDSIQTISSVMYKIDAIVFTAGSGAKTGADKTLTVDLDGAVKCMIAAEHKGIKRFVMISALKTASRQLWEQNPKLKPYLVAKYYADIYLQSTNLGFTILRPGRLTDEPGTGKITIEKAHEKETISREDVASIVIETLKNNSTIQKVIDFNNGEMDITDLL